MTEHRCNQMRNYESMRWHRFGEDNRFVYILTSSGWFLYNYTACQSAKSVDCCYYCKETLIVNQVVIS
jgi:hypothetical protein